MLMLEKNVLIGIVACMKVGAHTYEYMALVQ